MLYASAKLRIQEDILTHCPFQLNLKGWSSTQGVYVIAPYLSEFE